MTKDKLAKLLRPQLSYAESNYAADRILASLEAEKGKEVVLEKGTLAECVIHVEYRLECGGMLYNKEHLRGVLIFPEDVKEGE